MKFNPLNLIALPITKIIGAVTGLIVAIIVLIVLGGYMAEKATGIQTLPPVLAPSRKTETEKLQDDQRDCIMYIVLVDTKAAAIKSTQVEDKIIRAVLNHEREYKTRPCEIFHEMKTLVAVGDVREVPNRQDLYVAGEFMFAGKRKEALRKRIDEIRQEPDNTWKATHYIRPDRKRTAGNQTDAEKKRLGDTLDVIKPKKVKQPNGAEIDDPLDGGFVFFQPKPKPR